ncbi:hypothetical protein CEXT_96071 [Caerostris extrusa]|uniref:Uncharacterized protein n=1 Tax=Caerostris extrusa TaxID=172846 RepID=A0AAV4W4K4_CAEEX|nr:hypothetical protein CEXT_96071 [Caerostris extrusa]
MEWLALYPNLNPIENVCYCGFNIARTNNEREKTGIKAAKKRITGRIFLFIFANKTSPVCGKRAISFSCRFCVHTYRVSEKWENDRAETLLERIPLERFNSFWEKGGVATDERNSCIRSLIKKVSLLRVTLSTFFLFFLPSSTKSFENFLRRDGGRVGHSKPIPRPSRMKREIGKAFWRFNQSRKMLLNIAGSLCKIYGKRCWKSDIGCFESILLKGNYSGGGESEEGCWNFNCENLEQWIV